MHLSRSDKELLLLLGGLISDPIGLEAGNHSYEEVPLSNAEAARLIELLEELLSSKKFLESCHFVEGLSRGREADIATLRDIFNYWRGRTGRNKSMSWLHFNEFLRRYNSEIDPERSRHLPRLREMSFSYFMRMERILLAAAPLSPRVRALTLSVVKKFEADIELARRGLKPLPNGVIKAQPRVLLEGLRVSNLSVVGMPTFAATQIVGIVTLVADTSVLFTTRDWGVAGTFSTIAGAMAAASAN